MFKSFRTEIGPYEDEILRLAKAIEEEASLSSQRAQKLEIELQAEERLLADGHRGKMLKYITRNKETEKRSRLDNDRRTLESRKLAVLNKLSNHDYQTAYRMIRRECTPGTSTWICKVPEFIIWMTGTPKTLWFTGKLGSGKSVSSACVVAHLKEQMSPRHVSAYFFCRCDDLESLQATTIIGSIARQLISDLPTNSFRTFNPESGRSTDVVGCLEGLLSHDRQYFVVLDGLDECNTAQLQELAGIIHKLLRSRHLQIKLFWSSRTNVPNWLPGKFQTEHHIDLETVEYQGRITCDIREFVCNTLEDWLGGDFPRMQINDPMLVIKIRDRLEDKAQGMFLWVKLQLLTLCEKESDDMILAALNNLPRDLPETFERILNKSTDIDDIEIGRQIFRWITVAKRSLTVGELREAIGTRPLQEAWSESVYVNDMTIALGCCGNLLLIEEEQQTVHFTHGSVKQHLLSQVAKESISKYYVDLKEAEEHAGAVCVTYLNLPIFNRQVAASANSIDATSIPSTILKSSLNGKPSTNRIALSLLRQSSRSSRLTTRPLEEAAGITEAYLQSKAFSEHALQAYAKQFWLEHTKSIYKHDTNSKKLCSLWENLISEATWRNTLSGVPWTAEELERGHDNVVDWIDRYEHCSLAHFIVSPPRKFQEIGLGALLNVAARRGWESVIEAAWGSNHIAPDVLNTCLRTTARVGNLGTVNQLLRMNANVNAACAHGNGESTALQAAAEWGHLDIVERLL